MIQTHTTSPEWYNENELRAFPLADDARGAARIPPACVVDMAVTVDGLFERVFLSSFYLSQTVVSLSVSGVDAGGVAHGLLTCTRTRDELAPYRTCGMDAVSDLACGVVVFGDLSLPSVPDCAAGPLKLRLSPDDGALHPAVVTRAETGWISRVVDDAHETSARGIVDLSGNPAFTTSLREIGDTRYVQIAAADGVAEQVASTCNTKPSLDACGMTPVKSINGVRPTPSGVITLRFI